MARKSALLRWLSKVKRALRKIKDSGDIGAYQVIGKRSAPLPNWTRDPHLETVIGPDDRILVKDTSRFPWRAIAQLEITPQAGNAGPLIGTAWFAGPKTLITAGHCVSRSRTNWRLGAIDNGQLQENTDQTRRSIGTLQRALRLLING